MPFSFFKTSATVLFWPFFRVTFSSTPRSFTVVPSRISRVSVPARISSANISAVRAAAAVTKGRKVAPGVRAMVVPGSGLVKHQAEEEGLDKIFLDAGWEWREAGCSMCLGMNPDKVPPGERCASTSNRNFEGRQGPGARTHLVSPAMAAAAAVTGHLADVRELTK